MIPFNLNDINEIIEREDGFLYIKATTPISDNEGRKGTINWDIPKCKFEEGTLIAYANENDKRLDTTPNL